MGASTTIVSLPSDFLGQVFNVAGAILNSGIWYLVGIALGLMLAIFFAGKFITWVKKAVSRGKKR
jgi:preprotein translocase subunit SecF